jgi:hypothetical protein
LASASANTNVTASRLRLLVAGRVIKLRTASFKMKNTSINLFTREQLQWILRAWNVKVVVPIRGDFKLTVSFPKQHLNVAKIRKTKKKSTYNKPLYEAIIFKDN